MVVYKNILNNESDIVELYNTFGWNGYLKLKDEQLILAMKNSFYVLYVYDGNKLIGTGRVISDGVINAYICGIGVLEEYRGNGIGTEIADKLTKYCKSRKLHVQLVCEDELVPMYKRLGYKKLGAALKHEEGD